MSGSQITIDEWKAEIDKLASTNRYGNELSMEQFEAIKYARSKKVAWAKIARMFKSRGWHGCASTLITKYGEYES